MKFTVRLLFRLFFLALLLIEPVCAESDSQKAHTHGLATLTLALENGILEIHFESPAANLLGFEHIALSEQERKVVAETEMTLKEPMHLFSFNGTNCQTQETIVDLSGVMDDQHKKKKGNNEHEHHDHSEQQSEASHSEVSVKYRFSCNNAKKLASVSVTLMEHFPGIEKIDAMWLTETRQGAVSLTSNSHDISFR